MERVIEYKVCKKEWDAGYNTYYDRPLFVSNSYEKAEEFALKCNG